MAYEWEIPDDGGVLLVGDAAVVYTTQDGEFSAALRGYSTDVPHRAVALWGATLARLSGVTAEAERAETARIPANVWQTLAAALPRRRYGGTPWAASYVLAHWPLGLTSAGKALVAAPEAVADALAGLYNWPATLNESAVERAVKRGTIKPRPLTNAVEAFVRFVGASSPRWFWDRVIGPKGWPDAAVISNHGGQGLLSGEKTALMLNAGLAGYARSIVCFGRYVHMVDAPVHDVHRELWGVID